MADQEGIQLELEAMTSNIQWYEGRSMDARANYATEANFRLQQIKTILTSQEPTTWVTEALALTNALRWSVLVGLLEVDPDALAKHTDFRPAPEVIEAARAKLAERRRLKANPAPEASYTISYSDDARETYLRVLARYIQAELVVEVFLTDGTSVEAVLIRTDSAGIWAHEHTDDGITGRLITLTHDEIAKIHVF